MRKSGFPISERIAHDWRLPNALPLAGLLHSAGSRFDQDLVPEWRAAEGRARFSRIPIWRERCGCCSQQGADAFYKGEIARAIVAKSRALGGTMTLEDLANYKGEWVEPARTQLSRL